MTDSNCVEPGPGQYVIKDIIGNNSAKFSMNPKRPDTAAQKK